MGGRPRRRSPPRVTSCAAASTTSTRPHRRPPSPPEAPPERCERSPALLESLIADLGSRAPGRIAAAYGFERSRARTIVAGALILAEVQRRLEVPFEVARGGLREGAALALARVAQAA
jgi:hypothetical protein